MNFHTTHTVLPGSGKYLDHLKSNHVTTTSFEAFCTYCRSLQDRRSLCRSTNYLKYRDVHLKGSLSVLRISSLFGELGAPRSYKHADSAHCYQSATCWSIVSCRRRFERCGDVNNQRSLVIWANKKTRFNITNVNLLISCDFISILIQKKDCTAFFRLALIVFHSGHAVGIFHFDYFPKLNPFLNTQLVISWSEYK